MIRSILFLSLLVTATSHRLRVVSNSDADTDVVTQEEPEDTTYVKLIISGIESDSASASIPSVPSELQKDSEDVSDLDASRLFSTGQIPEGWAKTLTIAGESQREGALSLATQTCLQKGYCKIEEKILCDVGRVEEICASTNHLFSGKEQCNCYCDPNVRAACPDVDGLSKRHVWNEVDCSCQCIEDGDNYCLIPPEGHIAKHMSEAPGCDCVCDSTAEATCDALPERDGKALWKWVDDECECVCQLSEADCKPGQVFYDDRCTCTCVEEERTACQEDTTGTLQWEEDSCSCMCKDANAKNECVGKQVKNTLAAKVQSAADELGWIWNDAPKCSCECTADEPSCKALSGGKDWVATNTLSTSAEDSCGCDCREGAAEECLKKRTDSGPTSLWLWKSFPSCGCSCPSPGTENACKKSSDDAKKAWTERKHTLPMKEYAGHVIFNAQKCSCECDAAQEKKCHKLEQDASKINPFKRGRWKWSGEGSCSCSCSLDSQPSKDGTGDKCTMRDTRLVFDAKNPQLCQCVCGSKHDKKTW